ncbi:MAG: radical SAM protein [Bacteroidales bacterium]|nr:radical SAM protein [Bacteroidales bacterium]
MATKLFETLIVGPIHSRRLGSSLGINLMPEHGKICTFDCIYCECGWNKDHSQDKHRPTAAQVEKALEERALELQKDNVKVDSITFSGNGEPTAHPDFSKIVDITIRIRDKYLKGAKVSVLSNASMIWKEDVREALMKVDNPILKIDSTEESLVRAVNRPNPGYILSRTIEDLKKFNGKFILQTIFFKGKAEDPKTGEILDIDLTDPKLAENWRNLVRELHPRQVMMYTLDRDTPAKGLSKASVEEMKVIAAPLVEEGFSITINGEAV